MPESPAKAQPWSRYGDAPVVQIVPIDPLPVKATVPLPVTVVDFQMSFSSMVAFMVKWSLASIPAVIILTLAVFAVFFGIGMLLPTAFP
jgi:hypothetical protein